MIKVSSISFSYKKGEKIIDDLSFDVPKGSFYGFLGANGSGKTTTIRLMLGLCRIDSGEVLIGGEKVLRNSVKAFSKIGSLIETPSYYGHLTGEENLMLYSKYYSVSPQRVSETLKLVGLSYAAGKKASNYSLGMKQRLGLALSIMHNPELLILDEPLNGLDPKGIAEIRELLLHIQKDEGKTIFISSHLLSEIENTCDTICIIDKGKKLFSGEIEKLRKSVIGKSLYLIKCNKPEISAKIITSTSAVETILEKDGFRFATDDKEIIPEIVRLLTECKIKIYEVSKIDNNLEELYLKLTNS